jgi:hypothetical protein
LTAGGDFWSRRKARVAAESAAETRESTQAARAAQEQALEDMPDAEILAELGLPDPDEMQPGDDFSAFLKAAVPDRIRRRALRKLWLSNPVLANVDGLLDYGDDFTDGATVIENMQTAYQVGKGMMKHVEELARQEAIRNGEIDAPGPVAPVPADAAEPDDDRSPGDDTTFVEQAPTDAVDKMQVSEPDRDVTEAAPPIRRRMRFEFET